MNGLKWTFGLLCSLVAYKGIQDGFFGSGNLEPVPNTMANHFVSYIIDGPESFKEADARNIEIGMKKYGIIDMPEFRGMQDPSQILSEFFSLLYDVSDDDRMHVFALARNLIKLRFLDAHMYFPISAVVYNFSEDKYNDLRSKFRTAGYFIVDERTFF